jgi:hypothetical protein
MPLTKWRGSVKKTLNVGPQFGLGGGTQHKEEESMPGSQGPVHYDIQLYACRWYMTDVVDAGDDTYPKYCYYYYVCRKVKNKI